ncbi:MAG: hypothetical protein LUD82_01790, partial [Clostridiales bacterium]|nr:hypothetical protein [Clostridiales bacterium]
MPVYDEEVPDFIETPLISGDFLNSVPGAMEMFVPELATEIEEKIKADQESDHPSHDKCINISITTDQLIRLVNGIKGVKRKKADFHSPIGKIGKTAIFSS